MDHVEYLDSQIPGPPLIHITPSPSPCTTKVKILTLQGRQPIQIAASAAHHNARPIKSFASLPVGTMNRLLISSAISKNASVFFGKNSKHPTR